MTPVVDGVRERWLEFRRRATETGEAVAVPPDMVEWVQREIGFSARPECLVPHSAMVVGVGESMSEWDMAVLGARGVRIVEARVAAERERCARIADGYAVVCDDGTLTAECIADDIRSGK